MKECCAPEKGQGGENPPCIGRTVAGSNVEKQPCRGRRLIRLLEAPSEASNTVKPLGFAALEAALQPLIDRAISCPATLQGREIALPNGGSKRQV